VRILEGFLEPAVELVRVGEDVRLLLSPLGPVDGHTVFLLPAAAGPDVTPKIGGDVLPGAEEVVLGHFAHDLTASPPII